MASKRTIEAIRDLYAAGTDDESTLTALVSMLASLRAAGDEDDILLVAEEAALRATVIGQFEIASQLWAELCALRPGDALTRFILAHALERCGRVDAAIAALEQCASLQPVGEDPNTTLPVARELERLGRR